MAIVERPVVLTGMSCVQQKDVYVNCTRAGLVNQKVTEISCMPLSFAFCLVSRQV